MSRPMPYVPMGPQAPLATPEDHTRMAAVLAKHAKPKVEVRNKADVASLGAAATAPVASGSLPNTLDPALGMKKADACGDVHEAAETEVPIPLEWGKPYNTGPGTAMIKSLCGCFRIDKVASQLSVGYTAWRIAPPDLNKRLGSTETPVEAKALCEAAR